MVDSYKASNLDIANVGKGISELLLVHIDSHKVYENMEFEEDQVLDSSLLQQLQPHVLSEDKVSLLVCILSAVWTLDLC